VSPEPSADNELRRWANEYAPAVLKQAEAEAVQMLRDALVDAALEGRRDSLPSRYTLAAAAPEPGPATEGHLWWAYCVLRAGDSHPPDLTGIEPSTAVESLQVDALTVLVSRVPAAEFGAEPLRRNLNDLTWLERVARRHEQVLDATLAESTIVPLRLCTLYESEASVFQMLEQERHSLAEALTALEGCLEWAVKVLLDSKRLIDAAQANGCHVETDSQERGEGSAYLLRRRSERADRDAAATMARGVADAIHARLRDWAIDATTRPPQNRDLSGHTGEMILNGAYLVERTRTDELHELVSQLQDRDRDLGVTIELTGPWPPYNFVPGDAL
jgi:hypothetical protein